MSLRIENLLEGNPTKNPPTNQEDLEIEILNDIDRVSSSLSTKTYKWIDTEADFFNDWILNRSILQRPRHTIRFIDGPNTFQFENLVNIGAGKYDRDKVEADSDPFKELDWLVKKADGLTYERLFEEGFIPSDKILKIPYNLIDDPDYIKLAFMLANFTIVLIQINDVANEVSSIAAEAATIFDSIGAILRVIVRLAFISLLLLTAAALLLDIIALLRQRVKYTRGMTVNNALRVACGFLGLKLETPFPEGRSIIPPPREVARNLEDARILGAFRPEEIDNRGFPRGSFGQFIRSLKRQYFLRLVVEDQTLKLVPLNSTPSAATVDIPSPIYQKESEYNEPDLAPVINLSYTVDEQDSNTITDWQGTNVMVTIRPDASTVTDQEAVLFNGSGESVVFDFARGVAKTNLSEIDKIIQTLGDAISFAVNLLAAPINVIASIINGVLGTFIDIINFVVRLAGGKKIKKPKGIGEIPKLALGDAVDDRVGMLALSADRFSVTKIVDLDIAKNPRQTKVIGSESAKSIYMNNWKEINQQFIRRTIRNINLSLMQVLTVRSELAVNFEGSVARVRSLKWKGKPSGGVATIGIEELKEYVILEEFIDEPKNG